MPFVDEMPTRRLDIPDEPGEWFEVRELSYGELEECRRERSRQRMATVREMGGEVLRAVAEAEQSGEHDKEIAEARAENERKAALDAFDPELLVTKSVVAWSYEPRFQASRLTKLDVKTFTWLFEALAEHYVPTEAQARAEGEGDSAPSLTG